MSSTLRRLTPTYVASFPKDPDAVLDYGLDWADPNAPGGPWLETDEVISTSEWSATTGITIADDSHDATTTTIWLSGGTANNNYLVTNRITTSGGRTDDRSILIVVEER